MIEDVFGALAEARALGFLGPGPLEAHVSSADAFAEAMGTVADGDLLLDLGSGGGVPGLLLAARFPSSQWVLLDEHRRRTSFLARAVAELGWRRRVDVVRAAAEEAAHDPAWRGRFDAVVARSFGPPAVTAEAATGFLRTSGRLFVAEPPEPALDRWPMQGLAQAGLRLDTPIGARVAVLSSVGGPPPTLPRQRRITAKHPLW